MSLRVLLTRAEGGNDALALRLETVGGIEPAECPLIRIEPVDGPPVDASGYDWVVLTSRFGVEGFFRRLQGDVPRVAAIGPATAEAVRAHGVEPALVASRSTQEGLLDDLPRPAGRVLFAGAEDARPLLVRELDADVLVLYRTVAERPALPPADLAVVGSASAARALAELTLEVPVVSIGPVTTSAARELGLEVLAEAQAPDVESLTEAVKLAASRVQSSRS